MLFTNNPLHKINNRELCLFLEKCTNIDIPNESMLRKN